MSKKTLNIDKQLKKHRILMGMTQQQIVQGILDQSTYSRVEKGKTGMGMYRLLKMLKVNQISLYDFFQIYDQNNYQNRLRYLFYNRDIDGLLRLKDKAENSEISDEIDLAIAALKRKLTKNQLATKLIDKLLHLTKWNEEKIFLFALLMPLLDWEDVKNLINAIYTEFPKSKLEKKSLRASIENNKLSLTCSISSYYYCIINGDIPSAIRILDYLRIIGFKNINSTLPSFG